LNGTAFVAEGPDQAYRLRASSQRAQSWEQIQSVSAQNGRTFCVA
jgi:hypothetical protein